MKKSTYLLLSLSLGFIMQSCVSNKKFILLQNAQNLKVDSSNGTYTISKYDYLLQVNDILFIAVTSDDERVSKLFSPTPTGNVAQMAGQGGGGTGSMMYYTGYTVESDGNITLPMLGKITAKGKTVLQVKDEMDKLLANYFKFYHLFIQLAEQRVSVLGEVGRPGKYNILQGQVNLLELLAIVGDFKPIANRKKVTIVRQYPDGVKFHTVDFTAANLVQSPFFLLKSNDIIYVEPVKSRSLGDLSTVQATLNTVAPLINTVLIVLNTYLIFRNIK